MGEFRKKQFADFVSGHGLKGRTLLEVGCGQGEYLQLMQGAGAQVVGFENHAPSVQSARQNGLKVHQGFLENSKTQVPGGPFDGFFCLNFLEHIPDLNSFLRAIGTQLKDDGIGLIEVPNLDLILRERLVSEFMTDHLWYFTRDTLRRVLELNGYEVLSCEEVWQNYILSAVVRKRKALAFDQLELLKQKIQASFDSFLDQFPEKSVVVWGAGHQSLATLAMYDLGTRLAFVVDSAPFKQGRFTPATHLEIKSPDVLKNLLKPKVHSPEPGSLAASSSGIRAVIVMGASYSDEIGAILKKDYPWELALAVLRSDGLEVIRGGS
jgi:SAM-dependent methyltransferase